MRGLLNIKPTIIWGESYLSAIEAKFGGKFEETVYKKVVKYQSLQYQFVTLNFTKLYSIKSTELDKINNIKYIVMTALYDDLIDNKKISEADLNEMFYYPEKVNPNNFNERVLVAMHLDLLNQVQDKNAYWKVIEAIHIAQKDSVKQFDANTNIEQIIDITRRKGGYTLVMCRHYLMNSIVNNSDDCWYALGGLIQMTNDLFDTYKDTQEEGIHTFANKLQTVDEIKDVYLNQVNIFKQSIINLPVTRFKKIQFSIYLSIISAFGEIALNQLKQLQGKSTSLPNFRSIPRKKLIVDMEKPINIFRLLGYAYKNGKLWM